MITLHQNNEGWQIITPIIPTLFPDGTSQVWKLNLSNFSKDNNTAKIVWNFSEEAELIWVNQLVDLLWTHGIIIEELYIPYLPYARQDKPIGNSATFAKSTFFKLLPENVSSISTLDIHSNIGSGFHWEIKNYSAVKYIAKAIKESRAEVLVFPDKGAYDRYATLFPTFTGIVLDKVRDQASGAIIGLTINETLTDFIGEEDNYKLLIIDDICDGGATFINAAIFLHEKLECDIALYVTHGIFSKGFEKMIESGISEFYTTQSLIKNNNGYKLEEI